MVPDRAVRLASVLDRGCADRAHNGDQGNHHDDGQHQANVAEYQAGECQTVTLLAGLPDPAPSDVAKDDRRDAGQGTCHDLGYAADQGRDGQSVGRRARIAGTASPRWHALVSRLRVSTRLRVSARLRVRAGLAITAWLPVAARRLAITARLPVAARLLAEVAGLADCRLILEGPRLLLVRRLIGRTHRVPLNGLARETAARLNYADSWR